VSLCMPLSVLCDYILISPTNLMPFFIIFCPGEGKGQLVQQTSGILTVTEGEPFFLNCSYEAKFSDTYFTFWYIQSPGWSLRFLLASYWNNSERFQAVYIPHESQQKGTFNLQRQASQLKDSAAYFCAFSSFKYTVRQNR
uniref:Ig-like domain-containing protein n=1 Tax=Laticauda laticaudata TaxID=8630 RepID=A0A8C5S9E9_LATLA